MATDIFISVPEMDDPDWEGLGDLEEALSTARVDYSVENDGIGSYEYWGARGYDAGTNYIVVEGHEDINVAVCVENFDPAELGKETLEEWAKELMAEIETGQTIDLCSGSDHHEAYADVQASFTKIAEEINGSKAVVVFAVEWASDGEIS